jgi:hypothetical protein
LGGGIWIFHSTATGEERSKEGSPNGLFEGGWSGNGEKGVWRGCWKTRGQGRSWSWGCEWGDRGRPGPKQEEEGIFSLRRRIDRMILWASWRTSLGGKKSFQQNHGASATGTRRRFAGKGRSFPFPIADRLEPCQRWAWIAAQGQQDSFKQLSVFGMKEAVVADLDKAFGQDLLEEAGEKKRALARWRSAAGRIGGHGTGSGPGRCRD